ncbi:hypothetical protein BGZ73_009055 [Actinomortierella ambigua]|nr:hypothetical protein BGZ73_009055 [Actinomortierella ambigua]
MKLGLSSLLTIAVAMATYTATTAVNAAALYARQVESNSPTRAAFRLVTDANQNMCLGSRGNHAGGTVNFANPIFWDCAGSPGDNAIWEYDFQEGTLTTRVNPSQCLGAQGNNNGGTENGRRPIFYDCAGSPGNNARWLFDLVSGRLYTKENSQQCLVSGKGRYPSPVNNEDIPFFWPCSDTGDNGAWTLNFV